MSGPIPGPSFGLTGFAALQGERLHAFLSSGSLLLCPLFFPFPEGLSSMANWKLLLLSSGGAESVFCLLRWACLLIGERFASSEVPAVALSFFKFEIFTLP